MTARHLLIVLVITCFAQVAGADIYQWEYIDPLNPSLGKQQSAILTPGGAGVDAVPNAYLYNLNLTKAYLIGADLSDASLSSANLTNADLSDAQLTRTSLIQATTTNATFTGADVRHARLWNVTATGFTAAKLYSTASYQAHDLTGLQLRDNNLSGWNFANQNLTEVWLHYSNLTGADFTGAIVRGTILAGAASRGFTMANLYSTASYQDFDLRGIRLSDNNLSGWDFSGQDLSNGDFWGSQLNQANFSGARVNGVDFSGATLTAEQLLSTASYQAGDLSGVGLRWNDFTALNFAGFNLSQADFYSTTLANVDFTNANIRGADFTWTVERGFTRSQFESTTSYQQRDLAGVRLEENDLTGWNFSYQNLTGASFFGSDLTDTDFTGATIRGAGFGRTINRGFTKEKLYSTASYEDRDLRGIILWGGDMDGWNFADQNLEGGHIAAYFDGASFRNAYLANVGFNWSGGYPFTGTDFTGADLRGSQISVDAEQTIVANMIDDGGIIAGLDLTTEQYLLVRDYDGYEHQFEPRPPLPVQVMQGVAMNTSSTLELRFEADEWNSTISFEAGIPVALDGTLELTFAEDVNIMSQVGRTLDLFDWTGVTPTGLFTVASDYTWDLTDLYTTGEVTLTGVTALPGDIDGDGDVDGRDFLALQRDSSLGSMIAWQANYGDSINGMANFMPVPEPGSLVLGAIVLAIGARTRRLRSAAR